MNESQIPIVSMNLRTPANIKSLKNTAVPQELIEGIDIEDCVHGCVTHELTSASSLEKQLEALRALLLRVCSDEVCSSHVRSLVDLFFDLSSTSRVRKVIASSFNKCSQSVSVKAALRARLSCLNTESPLSTLALAALRCQESNGPPKEALDEFKDSLFNMILEKLPSEHVNDIALAVRALLCFCSKEELHRKEIWITKLEDTLEASGTILSPDTRLNLVLCILHGIMAEEGEMDPREKIYSAVVDEEMSSPGEMDSFSRLWHLKSERITVCHGCLVVLSDETFEFVPDGRQSPLLWEIFQHLDVACDDCNNPDRLLQISRALMQLVSRLKSFSKRNAFLTLKVLNRLDKVIWTFLGSAQDSVKHNVKDTLTCALRVRECITESSEFEDYVRNVAVMFSWQERNKYAAIQVLLRNKRARVIMLDILPHLVNRLLDNICSDAMINCAEIYKQCLMLFRFDQNWMKHWVEPLLFRSGGEVKAILAEAMKSSDAVLEHVLNDTSSRYSAHAMRNFLAAAKCKKNKTKEWKDYLLLDSFQIALYAYSDQIRLEAFSCVIAAKSSTERFTREELQTLLECVNINMKLDDSAHRQLFITLFKKMLLRLHQSCLKSSRSEKTAQNVDTSPPAEDFIQRLIEILLRSLTPTANCHRLYASLECITSLKEFFPLQIKALPVNITKHLLAIVDTNTYAKNQELALQLLISLRQDRQEFDLLEESFADCDSISPARVASAAYRIVLVSHSLSLRELFKTSSIDDVKASLLRTLSDKLKTRLRETSGLSMTKPLFGLLLCSRKIVESFEAKQDITSTLLPWVGEILTMMDDIRTRTATILESECPEGNFVENCDGSSDPQAQLLCAWRASKELSLLLAAIFDLSPDLLDLNQTRAVVEFFSKVLISTVHRGAFEQAFAGFARICVHLWRDSSKQWRQKIAQDLLDEALDSICRYEFCATRRGAGVPFLVQALVSAAASSVQTKRAFEALLLAGANKESAGMRTQAYNILRALYANNTLGEEVCCYVESGLKIALQGFKSATWAERNASSLLFSALVTRIFGVKRSKDEFSPKNLMTVRAFFHRFSSLYETLTEELMQGSAVVQHSCSMHPREASLFPPLILLAKMRSSPVGTGADNYKVDVFLPHLRIILGSAVLKLRQLAAAILARLYTHEQRYHFITEMLSRHDTCANRLHGKLETVHKMLLLQDDTRDSCLDVAKLILDPRSIVRKIIRGSVYSNCFPLRAKAAQVMLDMLDETCADETLEGDIVSALQNLPSQPGVPFLEAFTEASMTSLVMLNNWNPNVLKPWINSKDLFKTCIVRSMFYLKDKIRENCCSSLQLHKMKFATNSDLTWQWASILCRFCPREEECSNLMESILQLMRHSTVKKIKVACIELGAELLSRGYQEDFKNHLISWIDYVDKEALSSSFGSEEIRKVSAQGVLKTVNVFKIQQGDCVYSWCRLAMDFVYDDCQWIRDFAHKIWWSLTDSDVQDVSISSVTPSNLGPMLAEAMMETLTDKEAVIRALEFTASSESELCLSENVMDVGSGIFEKNPENSWREQERVTEELEPVIRRFTHDLTA